MTKTPKDNRDSRELLLEAAKSVFARLGFDGATVKELADTAGVNVSLVSYYFGGKEGLYRACLEQFGRERLTAAERLLKAPSDAADFELRLRLFFQEFIECHIQEPEIATIMHRECASDMAGIRDLFKEVFFKFFERFANFVGDAQKAGLVRADAETKISSAILFGGLVQMLRMDWASTEVHGTCMKDPAFRDKVVHNAVRTFVHGILA